MSARRLAWVAAVAAWLAVLVGPLALGFAYSFAVPRGPLLLMLGSAFVLSAVVVAIRARLRRRLARAEPLLPQEHPARATLLVASAGWLLLVFGAGLVGSSYAGEVLYADDGVPWARLALLWLVASFGVALPAARWCAQVGQQPEGPSRF